MRENRVKAAIKAGKLPIGSMVFEFSTPGIARIAASAGAEFLIYDMEHTGWSIETIRELMATSRGADLVPMVRLPASEYNFIARALDVGAMGLMLPMVESVEQARSIVQSAKYPPVGKRGAAFGIAHDDYASGDVAQKMKSANDELLLIAQIETKKGLEAVESIAGVDGIDVIWIGQFDLTISLGIPGQFDHPDYLAAVERVVKAAKAAGKVAGFMVTSPQEGKTYFERGFGILAYSGDLWIYGQALGQAIQAIRG